MSPRFASAITSSPAERPYAHTSSKARMPGAPSVSKNAACGLDVPRLARHERRAVAREVDPDGDDPDRRERDARPPRRPRAHLPLEPPPRLTREPRLQPERRQPPPRRVAAAPQGVVEDAR